MSLDPRNAGVVFRERAAVDVLDLAVRFQARHVVAYGKLASVTILPAFALAATSAAVLGWGPGFAIGLALSTATSVPFTVLASRLVFDDRADPREVLLTSLRALPQVLSLRAAALLLAAIGATMLLVPGIWVWVSLTFTTEVALLEGGATPSSLSRATRVARAAFGEALLSVVLLGSLLAAAIVLADVGGRMVLESLLEIRPPRSLFDAGGSHLALAGLFLAMPYLATARFFAYLDARTRAEGWDVQTRFMALAVRTAGGVVSGERA